MRAVDLEAEMSAAALRVRQTHIDRMMSLGVSVQAMQQLFPRNYLFGLERVSALSGGLYEPDEAGRWAAIMPVGEYSAELGIDETFDLIAFHTREPTRWRWRLGNAWALGSDLLDRDWPPVPVVRTPLDWLAVGGDAVCILDWSKQHRGWGLLRDCPGLTFDDESLRRKLRNALVRSVALPPMEIERAA